MRGAKTFDLVLSPMTGASVPAYGGGHDTSRWPPRRSFHDLAVLDDDTRYPLRPLFIGTAWPNRVATLNALSARTAAGREFKWPCRGTSTSDSPHSR